MKQIKSYNNISAKFGVTACNALQGMAKKKHIVCTIIEKTDIRFTNGIKRLTTHNINKIIITCPEVRVNESHGLCFLTRLSTNNIQNSVDDIPISLRGHHFPNCIIIGDDASNMSLTRIKALLTHIGEDTELILTFESEPIENNVLKKNYSNNISVLLEDIIDLYDSHGSS
jgi:hypothetical protein